ncbi:FdhF/YdeP family oxidoreductase [Pseudactinotalea sp. Z1748]|uniref:FdhF/YdeP family oxidoreductase n=1 Tax=Pseudactinotalea sp. Z1748 TaxID=3413027 RepID=UPI003C7C4387
MTEDDLKVTTPPDSAVGPAGVTTALRHVLREMGPVRGAAGLLKLNQPDGVDCMSCAWPDPEAGERSHAEFCENGAKALASEATRKRVPPEFFAEHSIADLARRDDYWLNRQGRLTTPMLKEAGDTNYRPTTWEQAFTRIATELRSLADPDQAAFYTSGRTSNEAAFLYQLMVRGFGTNNLPDCSNMCHESSGEALGRTIGIGKGSVTLHDVHMSKLIVIAGQNAGTNHPRMLTALEKAKRNGATIVSINPLREAGLGRYKNPQSARGLLGRGTQLADLHLPVRLAGDLALFQGLGKFLLDAHRAGRRTPGRAGAIDEEFLAQHTHGFEDYAAGLAVTGWADIETASGLSRDQIEELGELLLASEATVFAWAMGLTQHRHAVPTITEIVNVALLQGNLGKTGAGLLPVRGHSNVQGDRTMGIYEKMPQPFLDALGAEFSFTPPAEHGVDTVNAVRAMRDGRVRFFMAMGGNFVKSAPDTAVTEAALASCAITVHVATKLNHTHLVPGRASLLLPCLARSDLDVRAGGRQRVSVEDSMSMVHASSGHLQPPSKQLRSEIAIVCGIARELFTDSRGRPLPGAPEADWEALAADYRLIRRHIEAVVPGFTDFEARLDHPGGFRLPHGPHDVRTFDTQTARATFSRNDLWWPQVPRGRLLLQTLRSHDQFNTTVYGMDDRYRGIAGGRRVVMVNKADLTELGLADGDLVDLVSEWRDGSQRRAPGFRVVVYDTPRGCAAAYFPETNVLVPLDDTAIDSGTPVYKSVVVRLEPTG